MRAPISLGFLTPDPQRVSGGPWLVVGDGPPIEDPEAYPDWDYFTPVVIERKIAVRLDDLRKDCGLADESVVIGIITWHSSWTNLRGASTPVQLGEGENVLSLKLPGQLLGGRLSLEARVVLGNNFTGVDVLAPHRPGSTLWAEGTRIELEGVGNRFPIMPLPFDDAGIAGGGTGAWALLIDNDDLASSGSGSIRLCLNSSHPRVQALLADPDATDSRVLREFIHYDVARQLLVLALNHNDLDETDSYDGDTLGALLLGLLRRTFPGRDLDSLRGDYQMAPGEFEAEVQARVRLLVP